MRLLVYSLAVWRLSYMLHKENGPNDIFARLRYWAGVRVDSLGLPHGQGTFLGDLLACFYCTSVWAALILLIAPYRLLVALAGSAGAIMIHRKVFK